MLKLFAFVQASAISCLERLDREEGQTMAEYTIVLALITLAVIASIALLSTGFQNTIQSVADLLVG